MNRRRVLKEPGFTLLETMLALAFLAVASGLTLKMHQARLEYDRGAMNRLARQLKVENVTERLSLVGDEQLVESAKRIAAESDVEIKVEPFETELPSATTPEASVTSGWHITVSSQSAVGRSAKHSWRLKRQP